MTRTIRLEIPARTDHLALVRRVVATAASVDKALPSRRIDDLSLAVSEACANAVDAQRRSGATAPILITVELESTSVSVVVADHAGGFAPEEVDALPAVDDPGRLRHERGLGLPLMRSLSDTVTFTGTDGGTAVRITVEA